MDRRGQSALFDAFLFFIVALVASAAVLSYSASSFAKDEATAREQALAYAEDVRVALLRTTLEKPWYLDRIGYRVDLGQGITVERFLLDEGMLLPGGVAASNFEETDRAILDILRALLRPPFVGGIEVSYRGGSLWLGDGAGPLADRFSASWSYAAGGATVDIAVHLWSE
jgi:hypothetical protein